MLEVQEESQRTLSAYEPLPAAFLEFIQKFKSVTSGDEKSFFLCVDDYSGESGLAFKWNEFELIVRYKNESNSEYNIGLQFETSKTVGGAWYA